MTGQAGDRGLAIGAGDRKHFGLVATLFFQRGERLCKEFDLAPNGNLLLIRGGQQRRQFFVRRQAGAQQHQIDTFQQQRREFAGNELGSRHKLAQARQTLRERTRIGHAQPRARTREPVRDGQTRFTEPEHQCVFACEVHSLRFHPCG